MDVVVVAVAVVSRSDIAKFLGKCAGWYSINK